LVSQPADTLLSQINKGHGPTGSMPHRLLVLSRETGFRGLFAGLGPRMIMTAGLVSGQFLIYGSIKDGELSPLAFRRHSFEIDQLLWVVAMGAPPGLEIHKE
jgi:solute carrier family 25 (mitochondrial phosphate transporter), member 3